MKFLSKLTVFSTNSGRQALTLEKYSSTSMGRDVLLLMWLAAKHLIAS